MNLWILGIILFLFLDLILVIWIYFRKKGILKFRQSELNYIHSYWIRIIDSFQANPGQAVMDADKLLDYALKCKGFQGTLGEKLKKAGSRFSDLNGIWSAHKLRNQLAHELGNVQNEEAKRALSQFKRGLNDLGAGL